MSNFQCDFDFQQCWKSKSHRKDMRSMRNTNAKGKQCRKEVEHRTENIVGELEQKRIVNSIAFGC